MLLDPFEEQLDLPAKAVQFRDREGEEREVVRQEVERCNKYSDQLTLGSAGLRLYAAAFLSLAEAVVAAVRASRDCRDQMTHSRLFITYRDPETGKSGHSGRGPTESF
jgi:hypothetical protein